MAKKTKTQKSEPAAPKVDDAPLVLGTAVKGQLEDVPLDEIDDPPERPDRLPRPDDQTEIAELARSLREVGQVQPVMVERRAGEQGGSLVRVFGRRRIAAARLAGMRTVRAIVVPELTPDQRRTIVAVENIQRKNLTPAEEHLGVAELIDLQVLPVAASLGMSCPYGQWLGQTITTELAAVIVRDAKPHQVHEIRTRLLGDLKVRTRVIDVVAAMLAKSQTWVRDRMYVGRLGEKGRSLVLEGKLPLTHAREICKLADEELREILAEDFAAGGELAVSETEAGRLDELRDSVGRRVFDLSKAPWKLDVPVAGAGSCIECPKNSLSQPGLFEHGGHISREMKAGLGSGCFTVAETKSAASTGICTDHTCFGKKLAFAKVQLTTSCKRLEEKKELTDIARQTLRPTAIKARVEERAHLRKSRPKTVQQSEPTEDQKTRQAREQAQAELRAALIEYGKEVEKALVKAVERTPGLWSVLRILQETKPYQATQAWQFEKARKAAGTPGLAALTKLLKSPTWETIVTLEKECGRRFGVLDPHRDGASGMAAKIAETLGLEVGAEPTLEDFLPKADAASKVAKPAKAAGGAKANRRAQDDDEEGEE